MIVTPGTRLGHVTEFLSGPGTCERSQHIYATVVGTKVTFEDGQSNKVRSGGMNDDDRGRGGGAGPRPADPI